jgi:glycosyltransferase involved in cell wall biosynthesis/ubiquinone/menaquinone biosynthesis C-methylase UbiE
VTSAQLRPIVLLIGPLPPPAFGVANGTKLMVESPVLAEHFRIVHLDTSDVDGLAEMGKLNRANLTLGLRHVARLVRLLWRERPDVTLLTVSQSRFALARDWLFVMLSRVFATPAVGYLRGSGYADMRSRQGRIAAWLLRSILKQCSVVIVLGESLVDMARAVYPRCEVAVVPNGCPPAIGEDQMGAGASGRHVVAYVGYLSREKGLEDLLAAARNLMAATDDLEFVMRGQWDSPAYEAEIAAVVKECDLSNVVHFLGPASPEERADLLARARVLVVPSHSEGQPWVVLEAMSVGVPVVGTDTGAMAETIGDGGSVVPVGDSAAMARSLSELLGDDSLWERVSSEALRRHREHFTVEKSHAALAKVLSRVARPAGVPIEETAGGTSVASTAATWFSNEAAKFDSQYRNEAYFAERYELWTHLIDETCRPGCRVLDAGCGTGVFAVEAARCAGEVVAADPSQEMLDICSRRCSSQGVPGCKLVHAPIEALESMGLGLFDLALASSVLEYVEDLRFCLAVLGRLLRPGATLIASFPNSPSLLRQAEKITHRLVGRPRYYGLVRNLRPQREIESLMLEAGLVLQHTYLYGVPRLLRPISGVGFVRRRVATLVACVAVKL